MIKQTGRYPAAELLVGKKIKAVHVMEPEEGAEAGWSYRPLVLELEDGTILWPQADEEGNDGGALMGCSPDGHPIRFFEDHDGTPTAWVVETGDLPTDQPQAETPDYQALYEEQMKRRRLCE